MTEPDKNEDLKKFRQAGWVFLAMNLLYLVITYVVLPPMGIDWVQAAGYSLVALALFGTLAFFIHKGSRKVVVTVAAVYAARALYSGYTIALGTAFPLVPWVLPTTIISFYFLARALWDWR